MKRGRPRGRSGRGRPGGRRTPQVRDVAAAQGRPKLGEEEVSVDGTKWIRIPAGNLPGRRNVQNVLREGSGPTGRAKREIVKGELVTAWRLFVNEPMLRLIKRCTETEAHRVLGQNIFTVSLEELDAFVAILYARGAYCFRTLKVHDLWSKEWGPPFFTSTMTRNRFLEIMKYLRFDEKSTRNERSVTDKFCLVSELWYKFIDNCLSCYKPSENITVDEQLFPSKCRCPFTQYMSSKPDKYGVKYWVATDSKERYILNAFPYLGKDEQRPAGCSLGHHVVMRLVEPYLNKGRNVTCDNFFTSVKLAEDLTKKHTTIVGTLNRAKREVPPSVKITRDPLFTTVLFKSNEITLTSYQGKVKKNVLILSTLHTGVMTDKNKEKKTPETVEYYNATKCGVDTVDQMARKYSVRAGTRRWTVHVFYNLLDLAMINAHTMYKMVIGSKISRRTYMLKVAEELAAPYRLTKNKNTQALPVDQSKVTVFARVKCQVKFCKGNKTKETCSSCKKFMCGTCQSTRKICKNCESD